MRRIVIRLGFLVLCGPSACSSAPVDSGTAERTDIQPEELQPHTIATEQWEIKGDARSASLGVELHIGCTATSQVYAQARVPPGLWRLAIDYKADCEKGTVVSFRANNREESVPIRHLKAVMERCPISVEKSQVVFLHVSASGGLQCGGAISIKHIILVSAAPPPHPPPSVPTSGATWSDEQCGWLYLGLHNSITLDGGDGEQTLRFISELP